jgi:hypothetical protein
VHGPLGQTRRQAAQQSGEAVRLALDVQGEAVDEAVVHDGQTPVARLAPAVVEPGAYRESVLRGQCRSGMS